ncbi:HAD-IA family hydrolase [Patescibacteria group bacterium]
MNSIKALLVDGDGIVLRPRNKYFSDRLRENGYQFPKESEKRFFKEVYPDIRLGKKDLKTGVAKFLPDWKWDKSVDELLEFWFSYENEIDQEVIDVLKNIRQEGIKVYLASDHSKYRRNDLWEVVGLKKFFDGHFFSCDLGYTKEDPEFYEKVLEKLKLKPQEVAFFDDEEENVETAANSGLKASLYTSLQQLIDITN